MSEEILNSKELNKEAPEVSFSIIGESQQIQVKFADGERILPDYIVNGLGGVEKIKEIAGALAQVTYGQFMTGFQSTMLKQDLRSFQQQFVSGHFSNFRRF